MLDFKQYLTPESIVKLIQLLQAGQQTAYVISIQNVRSYVTDYAIIYCMPDTVASIYSALTLDQQATANFSIEGKDIHFSSDVLHSTGICGSDEFITTFSESTQSVWYFLKMLYSYEAQIVADDYVANIWNINFSRSTPTLSLPVPTTEGFRTKLIWSYEAYRVVESTIFRCSPKLRALIMDSPFSKYVEGESSTEDGMFDIAIAVQLMPGTALLEEQCRLSFNMSYLLDSLARYEQYRATLDGLSMAYRYVRWLNNVQFKSQVPRDSSQQMGYVKNLIMKLAVSKPSSRQVWSNLTEDPEYFFRKLQEAATTDELMNVAKLNIARCNSILGDFWAAGFIHVCDGSPTIREHEYFEGNATVKAMAFEAGIEWFKAKIQMLEYKLVYYCGTDFPLLDGTVRFIWEELYEL